MSVKLHIIGGTPDHLRHLCEDCIHQDILVGSHMEEHRCSAPGRRFVVRGRIYTCTLFHNRYTTMWSGTTFKSAWHLVNHNGLAYFLNPAEYLKYDDEGELPERITGPCTEEVPA